MSATLTLSEKCSEKVIMCVCRQIREIDRWIDRDRGEEIKQMWPKC